MNDESRSELGDRLDALADEATRRTHLTNPSVPEAAKFGAPGWAKLGGAFAAIALVIGGVVLAQRGGNPEPDEVAVVGDDSELSPEDALPRAECTDPDVRATVVDLLVSGMLTYDYDPAGSFAALAEKSELVVTGTAVSIQRVADGDGDADAHTVVQIADIESLNRGPVPDITEFSYNSWWADRDSEDPLATARRFAPELRFVAFLVVRSDGLGLTPGPEGLYVACGNDTPLAAVFASAAGPDESANPTIDELSDRLAPRVECTSPQAGADIARRLVSGAAFEPGNLDSLAELIEATESTIIGTVDSAESIRPGESEGQLGRLVVSGIESADAEPSPVGLFYPSYPVVEPDPSKVMFFDGLAAVAFVSKTQPSLVGGSSVVPGGLYVACNFDDPAVPVLGSVFGSETPSLNEIVSLTAVVVDQLQIEEQERLEELRAEEQARQDEIHADLLAAGAAIRDALVQLGTGDQLATDAMAVIPFADKVALGLHNEIEKTLTKEELRNPGAWSINRPEGYAEFTGPFDALETLQAGPETVVTIGEHPHCAGPPLAPPLGFEDHVQVSIQPAEGTIDSCIPWFAVDLWLDTDSGAVEAVTLALFGP